MTGGEGLKLCMCDIVPFSYCNSYPRKRKNTYTMSRTVYTECQIFFPRPNWVPPSPTPLTRKGVLLLPHSDPRGETHSLGGGDEWWGDPI